MCLFHVSAILSLAAMEWSLDCPRALFTFVFISYQPVISQWTYIFYYLHRPYTRYFFVFTIICSASIWILGYLPQTLLLICITCHMLSEVLSAFIHTHLGSHFWGLMIYHRSLCPTTITWAACGGWSGWGNFILLFLCVVAVYLGFLGWTRWPVDFHNF